MSALSKQIDELRQEKKSPHALSEIQSAQLTQAIMACIHRVQWITPTQNSSVNIHDTTLLALLNNKEPITDFTINFPANPTDGYEFTLALAQNAADINIINNGNGTTIVHSVTHLSTQQRAQSQCNNAVTYRYSADNTCWINTMYTATS